MFVQKLTSQKQKQLEYKSKPFGFILFKIHEKK